MTNQTQKTFHWKRWALSALAIYVVLSLGGYFAAVSYIKKISEDFYGFQIKWDRFDFSILNASAKLHGFELIPKAMPGFQKGETMIKADKITVDLRWLPLIFQKTLSLSEIELESPQIKVIRYRNGTNSLKSFLPIIKVGEKKKKKNQDVRYHLVLDEVYVKDGEIDFKDKKMGSRIELKNVDLLMTKLNSIAGRKGKPSDVNMSAKLGETGGKIKLKGTFNLFEEGIHFDLKQKSKGLPITYFRPYYQRDVPVLVTGGTMSVSSTLKSRKSYLTSNHFVQISNLQVEGKRGMGVIMGLPAKIFVAFVSGHRGTLDMTVQVNGNLEKGNFSISRQFSRSLFQSMIARAREEKGIGIEEKLKKAGEGLKETFKKVNPFKK